MIVPDGAARLIKRDANYAATEHTVRAIQAVPVAERGRGSFLAVRARSIGLDAAIESVVASIRAAVADTANGRVLDTIDAIAAGLVATRRQGHVTVLPPESMLALPDFTHALYLLWALLDSEDCAFPDDVDGCAAHPGEGIETTCPHFAAIELLTKMGFDPRTVEGENALLAAHHEMKDRADNA